MKYAKLLMVLLIIAVVSFNADAYAALDKDADQKLASIKISDEKEAERVAYGYLADIPGYKGLELQHLSTKVSTVTDDCYYIFGVVETGELEGQRVALRFFDVTVKVITDSEGNYIAISYDPLPEVLLNREEGETDEWVLLSREGINSEAEKDLPEGLTLLKDKTTFDYFEASSDCFGDDLDMFPAWFVYCSGTDSEGRPMYYARVYNAVLNYGDVELLAEFRLYSEDLIGVTDINAIAEAYFDTKYVENAGFVSFDVDYNKHGVFEGSLYGGIHTITVPIMKEKATGLYVLGSIEQRILVTNDAHDSRNFDEINRLVSSDPERLDSWHFERETLSSTGQKLFCDPEYIMVPYYVACEVKKGAANIFELGVENQPLAPFLLEAYFYEGDYPQTENEFYDASLASLSLKKGWNSMILPYMTRHGITELGSVGHEYIHGVSGELGRIPYNSEYAAVNEAYSDILGNMIELITERRADSKDWELYEKVTANGIGTSISEPHNNGAPRYVGDVFYMIPVSANARKWYYDSQYLVFLDYGGVHTNANVLTYMAYQFSNKENVLANEDALTMRENACLWYETLYMKTALDGFYEVASNLSLAARMLGLSEKKIAHVDRIIFDHGLAGTKESSERVKEIIEEYATPVTLHYISDSEDSLKEKLFAVKCLTDTSSGFSVVYSEEATFSTYILKDSLGFSLVVIDNDTGDLCLTGAYYNQLSDEIFSDYYVDIENINLSKGDSYSFEGQVLRIRYVSDLEAELEIEAEEGNTVTFVEAGTYNVVIHTDDMGPNEIRAYIIDAEA